MRDEGGFAAAVLGRHGIAADGASAGVYRGDATFGAPVIVTRPLGDGDRLELAHRTLRVLHRPGHSPSDTVLHDDERGVMLGADHVMRRPSVAILSAPLDGAPLARRPRALLDMRASLARTAAMDVRRILPGHGDVVEDPAAAIERHLRRYDRMTAQVLEAVGPQPRQALDIARDVRGEVADHAAFFVLCDILGCLDALIDAGAVRETVDGDTAWFHRP